MDPEFSPGLTPVNPDARSPDPQHAGVRPRHPVLDLDDEALDRWILTRLTLTGVDLGVLPEDDPGAPADQVRILRSARSFLRSTLPVLHAVDLDPLQVPPLPSPSSFLELAERG